MPVHPQPPPAGSRPWGRLKPVRQDPLAAMGYPSKGETRLSDVKVQESFYHKIVARYMDFCARHKKDLDGAFASLHENDSRPTPAGPAVNQQPTILPVRTQPGDTSTPPPQSFSTSRQSLNNSSRPPPDPADELSTILSALRKLREGLRQTSRTTPNPVFSQRVHIFTIRIGILAHHPESYHLALNHLLRNLHTPSHPLPSSELKEMTTYQILDLALRQHDLIEAYFVKHTSKKQFNYENRTVDAILRAIVHGDWVAFWRLRRQVDGYVRAVMYWYLDTIRKATLKTFGRAYLKTDARWLLNSVAGNEMGWEELVEKEGVGWEKEGESVIIRKPKAKS